MCNILPLPGDLAPGDQTPAAFDLSRIEAHCITSTEDPLFEEAYGALWEYFGSSNEMESVDVLARRFAKNQEAAGNELLMRYDLVLLRAGGGVAAVCDHTAVVEPHGGVVHVSHILIQSAWRRTGLAGWVRAIPIQTARRCLAEAGLSPHLPITLVAEVEYARGDSARMARLKSFERAGFLKIDPEVIDYHQPDFRSPEVIDATGGPRPLPFQLLIRRVPREVEDSLSAGEVKHLVDRLYRVYARDFRPEDMADLWQRLERFPATDARVRLILPTA